MSRSAPAPGVGEAAPAVDEFKRLKPPFRGDLLAGGVLAIAALVFALAVGVLTAEGLIVWGGDLSLLRVLNIASFALTVLAFGWSFLKDLWWLHGEEKDIAFVLGPGHARPRAVLSRHRNTADNGAVEKVQTLIDDRVIRVLGLRPGTDPGPVRESELRAVATWRSASLGTFARYSSGLLLLLTVLGTFVGVKFSLGPLQEALRNSVQAGGAETAQSLAAPLGNVAAAFGSNLTALVGAIAVGLGGFGLSVGRQNMLARLEQASSLYIYPVSKVRTAPDLMSQALERLGGASESLSGIGADLAGLGDRIDTLTETVSESMAEMRKAVTAVLEEQPLRLAQQSQQAVDRIEHQITDTVTAVQQATGVYVALVERLETQGDALQGSTAALGAAAAELKHAREAFGTYADSATQRMDERLAKLDASSSRHVELTEKVHERYQSIDASLSGLIPQVKALAEHLRAAEQHQHAVLFALQREVGEYLVQRLGPVTQLTEAVHELHAALAALPEHLQAEFKPVLTVPVPAPDAADDALEPTLKQLVQVLNRMERAQDAGFWRRFFRRGDRPQ